MSYTEELIVEHLIEKGSLLQESYGGEKLIILEEKDFKQFAKVLAGKLNDK